MLGQWGSAASWQPALRSGVLSSACGARPVTDLAGRLSAPCLKVHAGQLAPHTLQRSSRQSPWWPSRTATGRHGMPADSIRAAAAAADNRSSPSQPSRRRLPNNREEPADHPSGAETPAAATAPAAVPQSPQRSQQPGALPAQQPPDSEGTASEQPAAQRFQRRSQRAGRKPKEGPKAQSVEPASKGGSRSTPRQRSAKPPGRRLPGKGQSARPPQQTNGTDRPPPQQRKPQVEGAAGLPPPLRRAAEALEQQLSDASREDVHGELASRRLQQDEAWQQHCNEVRPAIGWVWENCL